MAPVLRPLDSSSSLLDSSELAVALLVAVLVLVAREGAMDVSVSSSEAVAVSVRAEVRAVGEAEAVVDGVTTSEVSTMVEDDGEGATDDSEVRASDEEPEEWSVSDVH